ncbi:MAG: hypoxanthine phosphoribosyltransferase [Epulopiscium sp. Nele67-Bin004]|nr:MAG: hypoxanthine phosphoribosyltransferase [Epulopiscium sp. Nele67-Bin004]
MINDIARTLITEEQLSVKIKQLGEKITTDYTDKDLLVIGILKGSSLFMSDLIRKIKLPITIDFMIVSSYGDSTETSGIVKILKDLDKNVEGKHILIVEDIIDTGLTLKYLQELLQSRNPASVKVCTLLDKPSKRKQNIKPDYVGFEVPDEFVVGYGVDYAEKYRNLPFIGVLKSSVYKV